MAKVFLGDVVDHIKDKVNKDETDLEFYVGGEHIEGREIVVRQKGLIQGSTIGPAFHMRFQKGDVLLMSRNPHLCKASMVDFDGICSDVSYVCRTKDNNILVQSLLPFIMQTDEFWQFAEENKKGGLPFFLNWKDFARFEFELIPIDQQRKISDLLWAFERAKNAYKDLIKKTDDLVKSQFIEMFGDPVRNTKLLPVNLLSEVGENLDSRRIPITGGDRKAGKYPYYGASGIVDYVDDFIFDEDILLISEDGANLLARVTPIAFPASGKVWVNNHAHVMRFDDMAMQVYIEHLLNMIDISSYVTGTAQPKLNQAKLNSIPVPVPNKSSLESFRAFVEQSDKSKFAAKQALDNLNASQKALMNQIFGE